MPSLRIQSIFYIFEPQKHKSRTRLFYEDMSTDNTSSIQKQKSEILAGAKPVQLKGSCVVGDGILRLSASEEKIFTEYFERWKGAISFFIPASGSGSRMFADLMQFVSTRQEKETVHHFFERLTEMALFHELPKVVREKVKNLQSVHLAEYLVSEEGMNYSCRPKGLIPFHVTNNGVRNPFQEQFLQATALLGREGKVHFTIQKEFEESIVESLKLLGFDNLENRVSFSYQDEKSNAYCFDATGDLVTEEGEPVRRPSGHGALLHNLNALDTDIVLIKNIDNVQHENKSEWNERVWKYCAGLLLKFKQDLAELAQEFNRDRLVALNNTYQFLSKKALEECDEATFQIYARRPSRVCGMVVNEGAPGGGPFWLEDEGAASKQIVEKVQISPNDAAIVEQSSHFNPVFIALSKTDAFGEALDLSQFIDDSKYMVVKKPFKAGEVVYRELPGLWNGSMHHWNSVFVEIPKAVFSPVKSVFDLLDDAHLP